MQSSTCRGLGVDARAGAQIMLSVGESTHLWGPMWISDLQFPRRAHPVRTKVIYSESSLG